MSYVYIQPSTAYGNITLGGTGASVTAGTGVYTIPVTNGAITGATWASSNTYNSGLTVSGDTEINGKLTVQGVDVVTMLQQIQDRLAILVPDPKLLDKYEALKQAYDNYKLLEALCIDADPKKE